MRKPVLMIATLHQSMHLESGITAHLPPPRYTLVFYTIVSGRGAVVSPPNATADCKSYSIPIFDGYKKYPLCSAVAWLV